MFFSGSYLGIMLVAVVLGLATQSWVNGAFRKYGKVPLATGLSGAEVARAMLDASGLTDVAIERIGGQLSDHYDPRKRVLRLSADVHDGRSVASAGVAAHEAGHAVQHARAFAAAKLRQALVPTANLGSSLAFPLIFAGLFLRAGGLVTVGVAAFGVAVLFQIVTLPVEFDASRRALATLGGSALPSEQVDGARKVLTAAAMTYLAATLVAVMQLMYFFGLSRR